MILCPRCTKENQDHYKFCLGCGAELPREAAKKDFVPRVAATDPPAPAAPAAPIPAPAVSLSPRPDRNLQFAATQQGDAVPSQAPKPTVAAAAVAPAPAPARVVAAGPAVHRCPACGNPVPQDFKFCGTCGHRVEPAAPAPVQAAPVAVAAASPQARGQLVLINPDGSEGSAFPLTDGVTEVGRGVGRLFAGDAYLSPHHATFTFGPNGFKVRDEHSLNGVYVKLGRDVPVRLSPGDIFRIGQEILRFEAIPPSEHVDGVEPMGSPNPGYLGRIALVVGRDSIGNAFPIASDGMHIGRERGDVIFPEDGYVSGLHCRIHHDGSHVVLTDVGSSNGSFIRIRGEHLLARGELLLLGQQLFRLQY